MKMSVKMFLAAALFPVICMGADKNGNFGSALPADLKYCDNYLTALDACVNGHCYKQNLYNAWLNGYITAYNAYTDDTFNIVGKRDAKELNYWLANYCKKHSNSSFDSAVGHLIVELIPQRTKVQP